MVACSTNILNILQAMSQKPVLPRMDYRTLCQSRTPELCLSKASGVDNSGH